MLTVIIILFALMVLFSLYLFLIAPNIRMRKMNFDALRGWDYAHRGLHNADKTVPENSLTAFALAVQNGFGIELDIRLTKDNKIVVMHDNSLKRICGVDVKVSELTLGELADFHLLETEERIPTFDEVLAVVDGKTPLIVELKCETAEDTLAVLANERLRRYNGAYCIESFNPQVVRWFKRHAPNVVRGQLALDRAKHKHKYNDARDFALAYLFANVLGRPDFIAYDFQSDKNLSVRINRALFRPLMAAWTVRSTIDYQALKARYDIQIFEMFNPKNLNESK